MYALLTGAIKNAGDFLIAERAKILLTTYFKEKEFLEFHRWELLDNKLGETNKTKAIILCGGPGYRRDFYPDTFRLVESVSGIEVPIIPYGLGWRGSPMYHPEHLGFSESSRTVLQVLKIIALPFCETNRALEI